jgi:type II secretory pathway component PulK
MKRQRGLVLLPMTLALALVAVVAYGMTRDGAMNVSAVDAQFDTERARYLAEAGVNLVKWRNQQAAAARSGLPVPSPMSKAARSWPTRRM